MAKGPLHPSKCEKIGRNEKYCASNMSMAFNINFEYGIQHQIQSSN